MFNDDSWDDDEDSGSIEDLLRDYELIKKGNKSRFLDEEDYEYIIEYFSRTIMRPRRLSLAK